MKVLGMQMIPPEAAYHVSLVVPPLLAKFLLASFPIRRTVNILGSFAVEALPWQDAN